MASLTPQKRPREPPVQTPEKNEEDHLQQLIRRLRQEHAEAFGRLKSKSKNLSPGFKGTPQGRVPAVVAKCFFCSRARHSCRWEYRSTSVRYTTGSTCFCCVKACAALKVSRSTRILDEVGLRPAVLAVSEVLQAKLGDDDTCTCHQCV